MLSISSHTQNKNANSSSFPLKSIVAASILKTSFSTICVNTILAPINRVKILLQIMDNISINESEKEFKVRKLLPSK